MTNSTKGFFQIALVTILLVSAAFNPAVRGADSPNPDFTKGGQPDKFHDWNLGPTGARGWIYGRKGHTGDARQILITEVAENSPADGILKKGDVIIGVAGRPFDGDARIRFAQAVTAAEQKKNGGLMELLRWRAGQIKKVKLKLAVMGTYSDTAPYNCPKSKKIFEQGCQIIAKRGLGNVSIPNDLRALALLASGRKAYRPMLADYARKVAAFKVSSFQTWYYGYATLFLAEYVAATNDQSVMPGLRRLASEIAKGASAVGTYGHSFAGPDGRCPGYGAMNQPTLSLLMAMIVSREAGVKGPDLDRTIAKTSTFMRWYVNKGAIPYGDHFPWFGHDDNGKCSSATVCFDLLGDRRTAEFFAKMSTAAYLERERGHTGNFFNVLWAMPGVSRCGELAAGAYMKELGWYYDLAREFDGGFGYQGSPQGEEEHGKYTRWDCTGAYMLVYALPLKSLYITGKKPCCVEPLNRREVDKVIAAGRDVFLEKEKNGSLYEGRSPKELIAGLSSWSPIVRGRSAKSLARCQGDYVPVLVKLLESSDSNTRYGACQALGFMGSRAYQAAPKVRALLRDPDPWLQSLACEAIWDLGSEAYKESVDDLLRMLVSSNPADPRKMAHRYAGKTLFNRYKGPHCRIVTENMLEGIDRKLLYPAIRSLLKNDDGWARSFPGLLLKDLPDRDLMELMPDIIKAVEELAPSGIMFASVIRMAGLEVITKHRINQGIELLADYARNQKKHGSQRRIVQVMEMLKSYGSHAKRVIGQLEATAKYFETAEEGFPRNLSLQKATLVRKTIKEIEASTDEPELTPLNR
jgi:HEAT repeat protein